MQAAPPGSSQGAHLTLQDLNALPGSSNMIFNRIQNQNTSIGTLIQRFEQKGLRLVAMKFVQPSRDLAEKHYAVHKGKPFYDSLLSFLTSGPTVAIVWEGREAVSVVREMMGKTDGAKSPPGTEIAVWSEFKFDAMGALADLLRKHGSAKAHIGIEMDYLPAGDFAALRELLPQASFTAAQPAPLAPRHGALE